MIHKLFQSTENKGKLPPFFKITTIILISEPIHTKENYRVLSGINMGAKRQNKILANSLQHQFKEIMHHNPVRRIPGTQGWYNNREIDGETVETVSDFIFWGSKIFADGDCSHEITRCLLLGRKVMTNLDSILKSRDITLPTKVRLVKAMVFPVVTYGCESWTIKKAER